MPEHTIFQKQSQFLVRHRYGEILRKVIDWVRKGETRIVLGQPPLHLPRDIKAFAVPVPSLEETSQGHSYIYLHHWPEAAMHASRFPNIGLVLEGAADFRIGATQRMLREQNLKPEDACHVLALPPQTILFIPPGTPASDGLWPHWERPHPASAHSDIFWINVLPSGPLCDICTTQGTQHNSTPGLFCHDSPLTALSEVLISELTQREARQESIVQSLMLAFLMRVERGIARSQDAIESAEHSIPLPHVNPITSLSPSNQMAVRRACSFIQAHLHESLSPKQIAAHAYVSSSHLARLFQAELGTSVMRHVLERRVEMAKSLLETTDLPARRIGELVGYPHPPHFNQIFTRTTQTSPGAYRSNSRARRSQK